MTVDSTLAEARADVETARTQFRQAWESTVSQMSCQPPTTT
jgi:hypothetical protein